MIQAIFYCEFDNIAGPQILFQDPEGFLSRETFESISDYIIIDKPLCGKIITVIVNAFKVVGYPVCIEDNKYHRNALLFNVGFVFKRDSITTPYNTVLKKLGLLLQNLEIERGFLSKEEKKSILGTLLSHVVCDLSTHGECTVPVDEANIISLKLFPRMLPAREVHDFEVPIALRDLAMLIRNEAEWDLALQQVIPYINGINYVKKISLESGVEIPMVKKCLRQLLYYKCVTVVDIFLYSNIYLATPRIGILFRDTTLQTKCLSYVRKISNVLPTIATVFTLYCSLQPDMRMSEFCAFYKDALTSIDLRRLICFGVIHGLVRRVHRFPVYVEKLNIKQSASLNDGAVPSEKNQPLHSMAPFPLWKSSSNRGSLEEAIKESMNGSHNTDEICCCNMNTFTQLEKVILRHKNSVNVIHK